MNDVIPICRVTGDITLAGQDIYAPEVDVVALRQRVGMVFQNQIRFRSLYSTMLRTAPAFTA